MDFDYAIVRLFLTLFITIVAAALLPTAKNKGIWIGLYVLIGGLISSVKDLFQGADMPLLPAFLGIFIGGFILLLSWDWPANAESSDDQQTIHALMQSDISEQDREAIEESLRLAQGGTAPEEKLKNHNELRDK